MGSPCCEPSRPAELPGEPLQVPRSLASRRPIASPTRRTYRRSRYVVPCGEGERGDRAGRQAKIGARRGRVAPPQYVLDLAQPPRARDAHHCPRRPQLDKRVQLDKLGHTADREQGSVAAHAASPEPAERRCAPLRPTIAVTSINPPRPVELFARCRVRGKPTASDRAPGADEELHSAVVGRIDGVPVHGLVPVYAERLRQPPRRPRRTGRSPASRPAASSESTQNATRCSAKRTYAAVPSAGGVSSRGSVGAACMGPDVTPAGAARSRSSRLLTPSPLTL